MKLTDRLRFSFGALLGRDVIGEELKQFMTGDVAGPGVGLATSEVIAYGKAKAPETKFEPLVKDGWRRNELIFACVSKKANTASQVDLDVIRTKDETELEDHPLAKLLDRPNPYMTQADFLASIIIMQDFAGNAYFEKIRSNAGRTVELWPMRPDWIRPYINEQTGMIDGYFYVIPGKSPIPYDARDILSFRLYDPLNMYFGYPPVAICARVGDLDNGTTDYIRLLFQEGGIPPGILTTTQPINSAVAARIRAMYTEQYGGYKNWAKGPMVLGYDTKYQATGIGLKDMGIDILNERAESRICMVLKVPSIILGTISGLSRATLNNTKEFQRDWWDNDLFPIYKSIADTIRQQLVPEFGVGIDVEWDFDHVPALQEDRDQRRDRALKAFSAGGITLNEFRSEWGFSDSYGPAGDVYVISSLLQQVPAPRIAKASTKNFEITKEGRIKAVNFPNNHEKDRLATEKEIQDAVTSYFKEQMVRIEKSIANILPQKGILNAILEKSHLPNDPNFWTGEQQKLYDILFPIIRGATVKAAKDAYDGLNPYVQLGTSWEVMNEDAVQWASQHTIEVVKQISKTSMEGFLKEFEPWLSSGEPLKALIKALEQYYDPVRAEMIGITETTRAFALGNVNVWKQSGGFVTGFNVATAGDGSVCPMCMDEKVGNPHELDDDLPPYHVRCRCAVLPVTNVE